MKKKYKFYVAVAGSNMTQFITDNPTLIDVVIAGSEEHKQIWTSRIRAVCSFEIHILSEK